MHALALAAAASLAAVVIPSSPAAAQQGAWASPDGASQHRDGRWDQGDRHWRDGDRRDRRDFRRFAAPVYVGPSWTWDSNRSFDADRWNDWWHERPHRAYPRWIQTNQNCERMWWSGSGWRC